MAHPFELDGRPVSTHPLSARGFSQFNSYLVLDDEEALLIDTGLAIHEEALIAQLDELLSPTTTLSLLVLRLSDFASVSNSRTLAERYKIGDIMAGGAAHEDLNRWLDFRPDQGAWREPTGGGKLGTAGRRTLIGEQRIGAIGGRQLEILRPKLQFIPTYWLYDELTGTLFTSDVFTHVWRETAEGPWSVESVEREPSVEQLSEYLVDTRYWWLAGAASEPICEELRSIRATREIECIAPAFGCVLRGREVVDQHFDLLVNALFELSERAPVGPDIVPFYEEAK